MCSQKSFLGIHAPVNYFSCAKCDSLNRRNKKCFFTAIRAVPWRCGFEFCFADENIVYGTLHPTGILQQMNKTKVDGSVGTRRTPPLPLLAVIFYRKWLFVFVF